MQATTERADTAIAMSRLARSRAAGVRESTIPRVVLAESGDPRVQQAARGIAELGIRPVLLLTDATSVAMLSFSTHGGADHPAVRVVREATAILRQRLPGLAVDGDLQFDAAIVESVAAQKARGRRSPAVPTRSSSRTWPPATSAARSPSGWAAPPQPGPSCNACGPLNDLSRGCSASDIIEVAVISVLQALRQPARLRAVGRRPRPFATRPTS